MEDLQPCMADTPYLRCSFSPSLDSCIIRRQLSQRTIHFLNVQNLCINNAIFFHVLGMTTKNSLMLNRNDKVSKSVCLTWPSCECWLIIYIFKIGSMIAVHLPSWLQLQQTWLDGEILMHTLGRTQLEDSLPFLYLACWDKFPCPHKQA